MARKWINAKGIGTLCREIVLIYFDVPELFVCTDALAKKYLTVCLDPDEGKYLLAPTSSRILRGLLAGDITMEQCFRQSSNGTCIYIYYDRDKKQFLSMVKSSAGIPAEDLPDQGAKLEWYGQESCAIPKNWA